MAGCGARTPVELIHLKVVRRAPQKAMAQRHFAGISGSRSLEMPEAMAEGKCSNPFLHLSDKQIQWHAASTNTEP